MRYVAIEDAKPGMYLAYDLYDSQGRTIIGGGCELTENYIKRLSEYGFAAVYIDDDISEDIKIETVIPPELRQAGEQYVKECDIDKIADVARQIVESILPEGRVSLDMADLRSYDDYTYAHSVNVAVLCCVLGIGLEMSEMDLEYITTAALLHDLGKLTIPKDILNKPGRLSPEEYALIKTHPVKSYELLSDNYGISAHVKQAVLLHHENYDGSGYPHGLYGDEQSIFVRVLHVCDVYDALTSNRPYKAGYCPSEAAEYLMGACGIMFDKYVVEKFLQLVPMYPKGTVVKLSNGKKAIVVDNTDGRNLRPIVRTIDMGQDIDLSDRLNLNITILPNDTDASGEFSEKSEAERKEMIKEVEIVRHKVMVVDDMATNLHMLKDILSNKYDVTLLKSGHQAVKYIAQNTERPDIILMDIDMPEMDGLEASRQINLITDNSIPILFVSAKTDRQTVMDCREIGAAGYIARPYKAVYIKSEIERILTQREVV